MTTRTSVDSLYQPISGSTKYFDGDDLKGPGVMTPGDTAAAVLLQDYGYSTRMVPEWLLREDLIDPADYRANLAAGNFIPPNYYADTAAGIPAAAAPDYIYGGAGGPTSDNWTATNYLFSASLVIVSGSGGSADMPAPNKLGIPIAMGEHGCIGDTVRLATNSLFMFGNGGGGANTTDLNGTTAANPDVLYMQVVMPDHPIMKGIPLDAQGRVKIWRDPYPEENAHVPTGGKVNWKYSWLTVNMDQNLGAPTTPAPGTVIIGLLASDTNRVVFSVNPAGGELAPGAPSYLSTHGNFVQLFICERGSGDSRRAFCNLTDLGRVIFVRACKWAMGETLQPYVPLGLIQVSQVNATQIQLSWTGSAAKNYKVLGTRNLLGPADFTNWQTVAQDIHGLDGTVSVKFDFSNAPQYAFLRVMPVP
jgi:hypothetical protein